MGTLTRVRTGYRPLVNLLLIPAIVTAAFVLPFLMALLEPKQDRAPSHRATGRS
jgi:uncharacterized protein involved in cysteine biosynthesis